MRRNAGRALVVCMLALACTAGPVMLPRASVPQPCSFEGVRTASADRAVASSSGVLGRVWIGRTDSDEIGWFDPVTLRPTSAYRATLPEQTSMWAVSPAGGLLAIGLTNGVRIIDTDTLRSVTMLESARGWFALTWLSDDLLVSVDSEEVAMWDARVDQSRRYELPGTVVSSYAAADRLLLVTAAESRGLGPVHLVQVDVSGVRSIELEGLLAGFDRDRGEIGMQLTPGLAFDADRERAFVVPPDGPIAEVDLVEMAVGYRRPSASFLHLLASALVTPASAKLAEWAQVRAAWLGDGLLAVSGDSGSTLDLDVAAAGVSIVDTRDWTVCTLDPRPTHVTVSGGALLAWGGAEFAEFGGTGLIGYDLTDGTRWHRFGRQHIDVQVYGRYAYAINGWHGWRVRTVDVETGTVLSRYRGRPPTVLPTGSSMQGW
jgi:hypothetical protein